MEEKRRGRQTPTVGFTLTYHKTKGADAVALYEQTGRTAQEWQKSLIYDILAVEDDGQWTHSRYGFSVPRQNGKNEVLTIREMFGITNGERILHTAHRTATSRAAWERLVMLLEKAGIREIKGENRSGYRSGKSKGQEWVEMDEEHGGGRCSFRTRSTTGGLGETFDLLVIDEAQEYQEDQESALKYTIVSSEHPQTLYLGTPPTVYSSGTLFPAFRKDVLCGNKKHAGWAEWSVEDKTDVHDVNAWYETNPSLGFTLTERAIEDEIGTDVDDFNIQRLGLWISYSQKSAISKTEWLALEVDKLPPIKGYLCVGIKFAKDGLSCSMSIAGKYDDNTFVECVGCRPMRDGVEWLVMFLKKLDGNYSKVVVDGANGVEVLNKALKDAGLKPAHAVSTGEVINAYAHFEHCIYSKTITHMEQPSVTQIVTNCEKRPIGSGGGFGYKAINISHDVSILDSLVYAAWGVDEFKPRRKQRISY